MQIVLPEPITLYLEADATRDVELLAFCFADNAHVHDEEKDYHGLAAIQTWQKEAHEAYQYTMEPLEAVVSEETVMLRALVTGNFPGSPVELNYRFTVAENKITELEIE